MTQSAIKFRTERSGLTRLVVVLGARGLEDLLEQLGIYDVVAESGLLGEGVEKAVRFSGEFETSEPCQTSETADLSPKARRLLKLIEQNPGLKRGLAMQKLTSGAAEFDLVCGELEDRGWLVGVETPSPRGRPSRRLFGTRPGTAGSQLKLNLEGVERAGEIFALADEFSGLVPEEFVKANVDQAALAENLRPRLGSLVELLPVEALWKVRDLFGRDSGAPLRAFQLAEGGVWKLMSGDQVIWEGPQELETSGSEVTPALAKAKTEV